MATLGPPEVDLAWFALFERFFSTELGVRTCRASCRSTNSSRTTSRPRGHPVNDLGWYTVWGAFRYAVVFMRLAQAEALAEVEGSRRTTTQPPR